MRCLAGRQVVQSVHAARRAMPRCISNIQEYNTRRRWRLSLALVVRISTVHTASSHYSPHLPPNCIYINNRNIVLSYCVWLTATRTGKLLPHLWYRPQDIIYVPAFIVFGYYFAIMKLYALCTLHEVGIWFLLLLSDRFCFFFFAASAAGGSTRV